MEHRKVEIACISAPREDQCCLVGIPPYFSMHILMDGWMDRWTDGYCFQQTKMKSWTVYSLRLAFFFRSVELRQLSKSLLGVSGDHCCNTKGPMGRQLTTCPILTCLRTAALWSPVFLRKSSAARGRGWLSLKGGLFPSSEVLLKSKRHRGSNGWVGRAPHPRFRSLIAFR